MANLDRIPTFKWTELDGKTLKIMVGRDSNYVSVIGKDVLTGEIFVLNHGTEREAD